MACSPCQKRREERLAALQRERERKEAEQERARAARRNASGSTR